jgi:hypothetical protein
MELEQPILELWRRLGKFKRSILCASLAQTRPISNPKEKTSLLTVSFSLLRAFVMIGDIDEARAAELTSTYPG